MKILKLKKRKVKKWIAMAYDIGYFNPVKKPYFIVELDEDEFRDFLNYREKKGE